MSHRERSPYQRHEKRADAMNLPSWLQQGIDTYGYWVVFLAVAIESTGIPFPGETTLVVSIPRGRGAVKEGEPVVVRWLPSAGIMLAGGS